MGIMSILVKVKGSISQSDYDIIDLQNVSSKT